MRKISKFSHVILTLVVFYVLIGIQTAFCLDTTLEGSYYIKNGYLDPKLHVTFLKNGYSLEKRIRNAPIYTGDILPVPYEAVMAVYLIQHGSIVKKINQLNDLKDFSQISSLDQAIEFVRLKTSSDTFFLFAPSIMIEIFYDPKEGSNREYEFCPKELFTKYNLINLSVTKRGDCYLLKRCVLIIPDWPLYKHDPSLFMIEEKVSRNGDYAIEKMTEIIKNVSPSLIFFLGNPS